MTQPKLTLKLNEQNELAFKLSVEGSSNDIKSEKSNVRFLVQEKGSDTGWVYSAKENGEGFVVVNLDNPKLFSENKVYTGRLEVILGSNYFVPTEVEMKFVQPPRELKVEATVVNKAQVKSVTHKAANKKVSTRPKRRKRQWDDLTESEKKRVKKKLLEKRKTELRKAKLDEQNKRHRAQMQQMKTEKAIKEALKTLMSNSLLEDE